ncbi:TRAP transporter small permease [Ciceribacter sp. L1K23]|uniref:TRAP transporter small permease n=1 Tax=Ciceribacter sp. L1K23 TaxID=2820276 RepID=UPI001B843EAA|nr:TRAP transporter small permease [Ciceribacter sp. L1K23]MBR0558284.1 TRAP transporter small permease [Ciceribacter sp. L1K23]
MSAADLPKPPGKPTVVRRLLDGLYIGAGLLAGAFLVAIFALMLGLSAGRPLGIDIPSGDDFTAWCMAACAFLGLAHTFRSGELIRMGLLVDRFEGRLRQVIEISCTTLGLAAVSYFAWYAIDMVRMSWRFNDISQGVVAVPLWIPQLGVACGLAILVIAFVDELFSLLRGNPPRYEKPKPKSNDEVIERVLQGGA